MSSLGIASSTSQMNKSWLGWRTGSSGVRSSPSTAEASAAIGASNREGEGSIVISLTPELLSSFHIRKRIIVISDRSEEHTSELQSLMRISYAVFCLKKKKNQRQACLTSLCTL